MPSGATALERADSRPSNYGLGDSGGYAMASFRDLLKQAKSQIREVDPAGAEALVASGALLLDVREPDEFEQGAVAGSMHIPRGHLEAQVEGRLGDHERPIVVMSAGGTRSAF